MARKNPFENLLNDTAEKSAPHETSFVPRGASKSISNTLSDLADKAEQLATGDTIADLDPGIIDPSFLKDRMEDDNAEFQELKRAIEEQGQDSPILVRPHPQIEGRYMIVFGSRRRRVAEELGIKVRAVIKEMSDRDHVVAQGQENAARANLSFLEKALLADKVVKQNFDTDNSTALSALSIDKSTLSKMLSVAAMDRAILEAIGPAQRIGRDRWYELKTLLDRPANAKRAEEIVSEPSYAELPSDQRFHQLYSKLKQGKKTTKKLSVKPASWAPRDKAVEVSSSAKGKNYTIAVKAKDQSAIEFGEYLSDNLDALYKSFKETKAKNKGRNER